MKALSLIFVLLVSIAISPIFAQVQSMQNTSELENNERIVRLARIPKLKIKSDTRVGHVAIEGLTSDSEVDIVVRTLSGRRMMRKKAFAESGIVVLDLSRLFEGNYIIEIAQNDEVISTKIVIE